MYGSFGVFLLVLHASAFRWSTQAFTYIGGTGNEANYRRTGTEPCKLCLSAQDCFRFNPAACEFYVETTKILKKDKDHKDNKSNPTLRADVDYKIYDIIDTANYEDLVQECIPYISKYTDCTKDNICLGCKTCKCTAKGYWNCTINEECRPDLIQIVANKKTLLNVIEIINKVPAATRSKRSIYHSMRSLEDMDLEKEMNDNNNDEDKLFERDNEEQSLNIEPANSIIYDDTQYIIPTTTEKHGKKSKELVELIVNSLINEALPDIFSANNLDIENNRVKRGLDDNKTREVSKNSIKRTAEVTESGKNKLENKITFDEISEWLDDIHPHIHIMEQLSGAIVDVGDGITPTTSGPNPQTTDKKSALVSNTITSEGTNPEYIAFEEVFGSIHFDNKTYIRRKPPLDHASTYFNFNVYDDRYDDDTTSDITPINAEITDTTGTTDIPLTEDFTEYFVQSPAKVVVDLLEAAKTNSENDTETFDSSNNKIENLDNLDQINAVNVMKRDVLSINTSETVNLSHTNMNSTYTTEKNMLSNINISKLKLNYLKDGVLEPLDDFLGNKQSAIIALLEIKERLVKFIQSNLDQTNLHYNDLTLNKSNYDFDHESLSLRRSNLSMIDKYKVKLKRDVYEVIRDVVAIRKLYHPSIKFPAELNFLIRSLKHYIHKTGFNLKDKVLTRRSDGGSKLNLWSNRKESALKNIILSIFDILIKKIRSSDALESVSPHSRRIIQRFIKRYYVDDFAGTGLRIYDPHYNMTNDLNNVGSQWQIMTLVSNTCPISDKLYNMKRLHLNVAVDAEKINDALALINFARGRRMVPADESDGVKIAMNINKNLNTIKHMIEPTYEFKQSTERADTNSEEIGMNKHKKKNSFLSQIRRLLKKSKKNIAKLLRRNVPKTDIVKHIARKDVEEMTKRKLEATMEKWQTNLNIIPRFKRSIKNYNKIDRRIANILPKYLRGKVHPGITKGDQAKQEYKELKKKGMIKKKNSTIEYKKKPFSPKSKTRRGKNSTLTTKKITVMQKHPGEKMRPRITKVLKPKKEYAAHEKTEIIATKHTKKHSLIKHSFNKTSKLKGKNIKITTTVPGFVKHRTLPKLSKTQTKAVIPNRRAMKTNSTKKSAFTKHTTININSTSMAAKMKTTLPPIVQTSTININTEVPTPNGKTENIETTLPPSPLKHTTSKDSNMNGTTKNIATTVPSIASKLTTMINTNPNSNRIATKMETTKTPSLVKHVAQRNTKSKASKSNKKTAKIKTKS